MLEEVFMFRIFLVIAALVAAPAMAATDCGRVVYVAKDGKFDVIFFNNGPSTLVTKIVNGFAITCEANPTATGHNINCDGLEPFTATFTASGDLDYDGLVLRRLCAN